MKKDGSSFRKFSRCTDKADIDKETKECLRWSNYS